MDTFFPNDVCHELLRPDFNEFGEQSDLAEFIESLFLSKFPVHQGGGGITESLVCLLDDELIGVGAIHEGCSNLKDLTNTLKLERIHFVEEVRWKLNGLHPVHEDAPYDRVMY